MEGRLVEAATMVMGIEGVEREYSPASVPPIANSIVPEAGSPPATTTIAPYFPLSPAVKAKLDAANEAPLRLALRLISTVTSLTGAKDRETRKGREWPPIGIEGGDSQEMRA